MRRRESGMSWGSQLQASDPLRFSDGQLEALKWIALASMFLDHFGRHLLGWGQDTWVFALGRIAFPLFALVLALNLRQPEAALLALVMFLLTAWLNASFGGWPGLLGTLAVLPIAWGVSLLPLSVPRLRLAFYLVYPLHLALIGALKA